MQTLNQFLCLQEELKHLPRQEFEERSREPHLYQKTAHKNENTSVIINHINHDIILSIK